MNDEDTVYVLLVNESDGSSRCLGVYKTREGAEQGVVDIIEEYQGGYAKEDFEIGERCLGD